MIPTIVGHVVTSNPGVKAAFPPFAPAEAVLPQMLDTVYVTPVGVGVLIGYLKALDATGNLTGIPNQVFGP